MYEIFNMCGVIVHKRKCKVTLSSLCPQEGESTRVLPPDANDVHAPARDIEDGKLSIDRDDARSDSAKYDTDSHTSSDSLDSVTEDDDNSSSDCMDESDGAQVAVFTTKKYLPRDKSACTEWMIKALHKKVKCKFPVYCMY